MDQPRKIFVEAGVTNVNREKIWKILRTVAKNMKAIKLPHLSKHHKEKYASLARYMKTDFWTKF